MRWAVLSHDGRRVAHRTVGTWRGKTETWSIRAAGVYWRQSNTPTATPLITFIAQNAIIYIHTRTRQYIRIR